MNDQPLPPISPEQPEHAASVDALIDAAFGPGRYTKAAERLREGNQPAPGLSMVALDDEGRVRGCSRMWPIHIGGAPALLLGPFAVTQEWRSRGLGSALIQRCCEAAEAAGHGLVLLVGDAAYFAKLGFAPVPREVTMPGPADPRRVLVRALKPGAADGLTGPVTVG
jgi:predicted N-acetyltransferase YhbS